MAQEQSDRGNRARFDRRTGEVSGSGAGIGNSSDANEDYDSDIKVKMPSEKPDSAEKDVSPGGGN